MTLIKEMFLNQLYGDIDEPELKITLKLLGLTQMTRKRCYHGQHAEESLK